MKKIAISLLAVLMLTGCGNNQNNNKKNESKEPIKIEDKEYSKTTITDKHFDEMNVEGEYQELQDDAYPDSLVNYTSQYVVYYEQDEVKGIVRTEKYDITSMFKQALDEWNLSDEEARQQVFFGKKPTYEDNLLAIKSTYDELANNKYKGDYYSYNETDNYFVVTESIDLELLKEETGKDYAKIIKNNSLLSEFCGTDEEYNANGMYDIKTQTINYSKFMDNIKQLLDPALYNYSE